jgi:hypothetical protein
LFAFKIKVEDGGINEQFGDIFHYFSMPKKEILDNTLAKVTGIRRLTNGKYSPPVRAV